MRLSKEHIRQDNYVIVNIWRDQEHGGHNVGHVSLQMPDAYLSLWPSPRQGRSPGKVAKYFEIREPKFHLDYETDMAFEGVCEGTDCYALASLRSCQPGYVPIYANSQTGRFVYAQACRPESGDSLIEVKSIPADERIVLFGLNRHAILQRFKEMDPRGFCLIGSSVLTRDSNDASHNCASLAFVLLCAGSDLISGRTAEGSLRNGSITTPEDIFKYVTRYKNHEVRANPDSQFWGAPGIEPAAPRQKAEPEGGGCTIF